MDTFLSGKYILKGKNTSGTVCSIKLCVNFGDLTFNPSLLLSFPRFFSLQKTIQSAVKTNQPISLSVLKVDPVLSFISDDSCTLPLGARHSAKCFLQASSYRLDAIAGGALVTHVTLFHQGLSQVRWPFHTSVPSCLPEKGSVWVVLFLCFWLHDFLRMR